MEWIYYDTIRQLNWKLLLRGPYGYFPALAPGRSLATYWTMGIVGACGLFLSIILHEACHSLVAQKYGLPMKGITLFIFGGIAEMSEQPANPKIEFFMAVAGPVFSILFSFFLAGVFLLGQSFLWPLPITGVIRYLASINFYLALFNLLPAFPLDGGRILRAYLWSRKNDIREATRMASRAGSWFGTGFFVLAFLNLIQGSLVNAVWWALLGMFLKGLARYSYQDVLMRQMLSGEPVSRFMKTDIISVPPDITLEDFIEHYVYPHHHKLYPVLQDERLVGFLHTNQLKEISKDEWPRETVNKMMKPCSDEVSIAPHEDAIHALSRMSRTGNSRLLVVDQGRLVGIITSKDILQFLSVRLDIEGYGKETEEWMKRAA